MTLDDVLALLAKQCERTGSQVAWAKANGVSAAYVSDVLGRRREPGEAILTALGLERVVIYKRTHTSRPERLGKANDASP